MAAVRMASDAPTSAIPRRHRWLKRLGVLVLALILSLLLVETWVRRFDPFGTSYYEEAGPRYWPAVQFLPEAKRPDGRIFEHRPRAELEFRNFRFVTNALALRSDRTEDGLRAERSGTDARKTRILFLGDSVTLGWGVDDADTWIRTLEREGRGSDGSELECLNAGHLQYNTIQEADWLAAHGSALGPDLVVLTFVVNDFDDQWGLYQSVLAAAEEARLQGGPQGLDRIEGTLLSWFRGLNALRLLWKERRAASAAADLPAARVEDHPDYASGWTRTEPALERIRGLCEEFGADLVVLDHSVPRLPDLERWCRARSVPWFDFTFSAEDWTRPITNSLADAHANALGNRLLADKAFAALRASGHLAPATLEGGR